MKHRYTQIIWYLWVNKSLTLSNLTKVTDMDFHQHGYFCGANGLWAPLVAGRWPHCEQRRDSTPPSADRLLVCLSWSDLDLGFLLVGTLAAILLANVHKVFFAQLASIHIKVDKMQNDAGEIVDMYIPRKW